VKRNGIRRRLKEIFRSASDALSGDLVISARPAAAEASFEELNEEFVRSLHGLSKNNKTRDAGGSWYAMYAGCGARQSLSEVRLPLIAAFM